MRRLGVIVVVAAALCVHASAQETTGTITGITTDTSGAVLPGVTVTLTNTNTGSPRTVVTNDAGIYVAPGLPVGVYDIAFDLHGFNPAAEHNVAVHVNDRLQIDGRLNVGGIAESMVVS